MPEVEGTRLGSVWKGIIIGGSINICAVGGLFIFAILVPVASVVLIAIGLAQFIWILPLYYAVRSESETAKGILIAAGLTVLLSATCWGILVYPRHA
jgi:hypothetical protein